MVETILKFSLPAVAFLCIAYVIGGFITGRRRERARERVRRALTRAFDSVEVLKQQMELIEEHSQEYFHTLVLSDFPRLQEMVETLDLVLEFAEDLAAEGDLVRSLAITLWLLDPDEYSEPILQGITREQRHIVRGWVPRSRELLFQITEALEKAHTDNVESGVRHSRKGRRPTEVDLRRLRDNLLFSQGGS